MFDIPHTNIKIYLFFNIALGEREEGAGDKQEELEAILGQGKQYKKIFCAIKAKCVSKMDRLFVEEFLALDYLDFVEKNNLRKEQSPILEEHKTC